MTSLLARLGQHDTTRWAARTVSHSARRQRSDSICVECQAARNVVLGQRRLYGDDSFRRTEDGARWSGEKGPPAERKARFGERVSTPVDIDTHRAWGFNGPNLSEDDDGSRTSAYLKSPSRRHSPWRKSDSSYRATRTVEQELVELWEKFETFDDNPANNRDTDVTEARDEVSAPGNGIPFQHHSLLNLDYKAKLPVALLTGDADIIARCLFAANDANDLDFLRGIPTATFSEIIQLLEPSRFVAKLASTHVEMSTAMVNYFDIAPTWKIAYEYASVLRQVFGIRRSAGITTTLADYTILLRCARDLGSQKMGFVFWNAMIDEGHVPTTACYNHYMSAVVWNGIHLSGSRQKVRVIPFNMLARKQAVPKSRFRNYRVGPDGVRVTAMRIFNDMLANGGVADEESYRILITASAREGDLDTVKSVLMKVWNVDVDAIVAGKNEAPMTPKSFSSDSPSKPTTKLLFAIAHAFGINNDVPAALRVVDFVARKYELDIGDETWRQLFEWTFVLSVPRYGVDRHNGNSAGQIPTSSLVSLWETMIGEPYSVKPSIGMYNQLIKNLFYRGWSDSIMEKMREARELCQGQRTEANESWRRLLDQIYNSESEREDISLEALRNEWEQADLIRQRNHFWMKRWLRLYLGSLEIHLRTQSLMHRLVREIPAFLWEWRIFAPSIVRYEMATGFVHIEFRSEKEMLDSVHVRMQQQQSQKRVLDQVQKLVGDEWVRGRERTLTALVRKIASTRRVDEVFQRRGSELANINRTEAEILAPSG